MPRYDFVLLDADHTLFDFDRAEAEALRATLLRYGLPDTREVEETYRSSSRQLDLDEWRQRPFRMQVIDNLCRLASAVV